MYVDPNGSKDGNALSPRKEQSFLTTPELRKGLFLENGLKPAVSFLCLPVEFRLFFLTKNSSVLNCTKAVKIKTVQNATISEFK